MRSPFLIMTMENFLFLVSLLLGSKTRAGISVYGWERWPEAAAGR